MPQRHTVLVVDDEPDVVKSVKDLLRYEFHVVGANRPDEGLKIMERQEVHIVMTDQRMPEMTGVEFLRRLRGEQPEAIRLLFTGYADIKAVIDAINQGNVYRYITKPWDPDELLGVIRQAAQHYDLMIERNRLMGALRDKNQQLQEANEQLLKTNRLKTAFIQVASHEFRTPLTILLGLSDLARRGTASPEKQADWLGRIHQAGLRLQRLVDQMTKLLIEEHFQREIDRRPTDLGQLLQTAADDVQPFVELRRQELHCEIAAGLEQFPLEADKIRDAVNHLLLNAIKFTPDGGQITLRGRRSRSGEAILEIEDSGIGIDAPSLPHIFEPFFTAFDVSHHRSGLFEYDRRGLGLGLSVVKLFVELHGGTVAVSSRSGSGSVFTIFLPYPLPSETASAPPRGEDGVEKIAESTPLTAENPEETSPA